VRVGGSCDRGFGHQFECECWHRHSITSDRESVAEGGASFLESLANISRCIRTLMRGDGRREKREATQGVEGKSPSYMAPASIILARVPSFGKGQRTYPCVHPHPQSAVSEQHIAI